MNVSFFWCVATLFATSLNAMLPENEPEYKIYSGSLIKKLYEKKVQTFKPISLEKAISSFKECIDLNTPDVWSLTHKKQTSLVMVEHSGSEIKFCFRDYVPEHSLFRLLDQIVSKEKHFESYVVSIQGLNNNSALKLKAERRLKDHGFELKK